MAKQTGRQINPNKLLLSKWTAVKPKNKEKHFLVSRLIRDEQQVVSACVIEAVFNQKEYEIDWYELKDPLKWLSGWQ